MIIQVPQRISNDVDSFVLDDILECLGITNTEYSVETTARNGRNIVIKNGNKNLYVIISGKSADGRNSFLAQSISTVLKMYIADEEEKEIYAFLLDTSSHAKTDYIVDTYRMIKTIGIEILNERKGFDIFPAYDNLREWKEKRTTRQQYNSANNSTYVLESSETYTIYGKCFGANSKEATLISCFVACLAKKEEKKVYFFQVEDNNSSKISENDRQLLESYGVIVENDLLPPFGPKQYEKQEKIESARNQAAFQLNLLNKYGQKKCLICENNIEESIIASHIHRITDINKSSLSWDDKCKEAVDPDNGIWLCANHDKMFENGLFYFMGQNLKTKVKITQMIENLDASTNTALDKIEDTLLKQQIYEFVKYNSELLILKDYIINNRYYNSKMRDYLERHRKRVNGF